VADSGLDEAAERLGRLCVQAVGPQLGEFAQLLGVADVLGRVTDAVRKGGTPESDLLADLDRLDDAFARHGIDGLTTGDRGYQRWRSGSGHPVVALWCCPAARRCSRLLPQDDTQQPHCGLAGVPFATRRIHL